MTRIEPLESDEAPQGSQEIVSAHLATGSRMTNMKWTAARAPAALRMLLEWYPLHDRVVEFLGERRTWLFCHAISAQNDCLICSTFFRRLLAESGEDLEDVPLDEFDETILELGIQIARDPQLVNDELYARVAARFDEAQVVELVAFGAIMVATNVFNDALRVPLDTYLEPYREAEA